MSAASTPRTKLELEYPLRSSPNILYQYISNPSGLQNWFADHVGVKNGGNYKFKWDDGTEMDAVDRKSTRLNSSHVSESRMPSSA